MVRHQGEYSRPPSLREISEHFGFSSHTAARKHVQALARKGLVVDTGARRTRAAKVPDGRGSMFTIPIHGTIPAGQPADNPADADETVNIDPKAYGLRSIKGLHALRVRGDSMIEAQIADGDIAIIREGEAQPNQIVAALIDGQSTLKRVIREGKRTLLRAENTRYRDLVPVENLTIQGVLVGTIGCGKR